MKRALNRHRARGVAAVEFALILPLLVLMVLCVIDLARGLQAQMIISNLSREGANLASRGSLQLADSSQAIIESLVNSAPPLDMNNRGMVYITRVAGYKGSGTTVRNIVLEQYRWDDQTNKLGYANSGYKPTSAVYTCTNWGTDGACDSIGSGTSAPTAPLMTGALADGDVIYAVEVFYNFNMIFSSRKVGTLSTQAIGPNLYSMTVF